MKTALKVTGYTVAGVALLGAVAYAALFVVMLREPRDWR